MKHEQYRFLSSLPREEIMCIVTQHRHWSDRVRGDYYGDGRIKISYYPVGMRSPGNLIAFNGTVSDDSNGTMITGYIKTSIVIPVFFWLFRAFIVLFVGLILLAYNGYLQAGFINFNTPTPVLIISPIGLLLTFLVEWILRAKAKEGKKIILHLLQKELSATMLC